MDTLLPTAPTLPPWAQLAITGAGAAAALITTLIIWRWLRTGHAHTRLGLLAVTLATVYAMEGMYEVATGSLGLSQAGAVVLCATFEVAMVHQGVLARHKLLQDPSADVRKHMTFVWVAAIASGVIASTASSSVTEVLLRLSVPPLAAGIWYMSLYADRPAVVRQSSTWIWTPQRIGVRLGLLKPGSVDDLTDVFRQRAVRALVDTAVVVWTEQQVARLHPDKAPSARLARASRRLQALAKRADRQTVDAARDQLALALRIQDELFSGVDWTGSGQDSAPPATVRPTPVRAVAASKSRRTTSATVRAAARQAELDDVRKLLDGQPLPSNRDVLAHLVRSAGMTVSNGRAGELLRELRTANA